MLVTPVGHDDAMRVKKLRSFYAHCTLVWLNACAADFYAHYRLCIIVTISIAIAIVIMIIIIIIIIIIISSS